MKGKLSRPLKFSATQAMQCVGDENLPLFFPLHCPPAVLWLPMGEHIGHLAKSAMGHAGRLNDSKGSSEEEGAYVASPEFIKVDQ